MPKFTPLTKGKELGHGVSRVAYLLSNPKLVLKEAMGEDSIQGLEFNRTANLIEAAIWNVVKDTQYASLFVPVNACASDGSWMIMPKVELRNNGPIDYSGDYKKNIDTLTELGIGDLHGDNVTPDGRVLDYSTYKKFSSPKEAAEWVREGMRKSGS